ncbi:MAG: minichromosome maintenance protein MCM [Methanobacteriaceae archaeon]|nr:minichromosome maintenance protein MCM [Methanobacteriaceae archaeon]
MYDLTKKEEFSIIFKNMNISHEISDISSKDINKLISFKAQVTRTCEVYPEICSANFSCTKCIRLYNVHYNINGISWPQVCEDCGNKRFKLENSVYKDAQLIYLEEPIDYSTGFKSSDILKSILVGNDVKDKNISPGDEVNVIGFLKAEKIKNKEKHRFLIEINNIEKVNIQYENLILTHDEEKKILDLAESGKAYETLAKCVAPSISGFKSIKKATLLQQFGNGWFESKDGSLKRETIHILLVGSPGVGKTQILRSISHMVPKGTYISCNTASSVGLTCAAEKNEMTGEWTAKAGAIPRTDGGTVCADELDKIDAKDLEKLNEALENGKISFAKAGLLINLNARCSILASANPKYGRIDIYKNLMEQVEIASSSTLSRFDLTFLIKDLIDEETDRKLLKEFNSENKTPILDYDFIRKYIAFALSYYNPKLSDDANQFLMDFYINARQAAKDEEYGKPITLRDFEGLVRLTKARARIDLKDMTTVQHAIDAINLYKDSLESLGLSVIEAGAISNVKSEEDIALLSAVKNLVQKYYELNKKSSEIPEVLIKEVKMNFDLEYSEALELIKKVNQ